MDKFTNLTEVTHNGITKPIKEWAITLDMDPKTLTNRFNRGLTVEEAFLRPIGDNSGQQGPRSKALQSFWCAFNTKCRETMDDGRTRMEHELDDLVDSIGVVGILKEYGHLIPKVSNVALDGGDDDKPMATRVMIGVAPGSTVNVTDH